MLRRELEWACLKARQWNNGDDERIAGYSGSGSETEAEESEEEERREAMGKLAQKLQRAAQTQKLSGNKRRRLQRQQWRSS